MGLVDTIHLPPGLRCPECGEKLETNRQAHETDSQCSFLLPDFFEPLRFGRRDKSRINLGATCSCGAEARLCVEVENGVLCRLVSTRGEGGEARQTVLWEVPSTDAMRRLIQARNAHAEERSRLEWVARAALLAFARACPDRRSAVESVYPGDLAEDLDEFFPEKEASKRKVWPGLGIRGFPDNYLGRLLGEEG